MSQSRTEHIFKCNHVFQISCTYGMVDYKRSFDKFIVENMYHQSVNNKDLDKTFLQKKENVSKHFRC